MSEYKSDFVIITATYDPEFTQLLEVAKKLHWKISGHEEVSGTYIGQSTGKKSFLFYACHQASPGMVSAAILATKMIELYQPKYVVMLGMAAGFRINGMDMPFGSVLIADSVANYEMGKLDDDGFHRDITTGILQVDAEVRNRMLHVKDKIIKAIERDLVDNEDFPNEGRIKGYLGPIVAGNQVVESEEFMESIKNKFRKVVGVEMEGFAIFRAAHEAKEPKPKPILIKSVCDHGMKGKNDNYQKFASYTSAQFFLRFAEEILEPVGKEPVTSDIESISLRLQEERERNRLRQKIVLCEKGDIVKFISITNKSFLVPEITYKGKDLFIEATRRGVKFYGIVLDPNCTEADCRSGIESCGIKKRSERLLIRDSRKVQDRLAKLMRESEDILKRKLAGNLEIRYSTIGLPFKLWLFEDEALVEPYHFGKFVKEKAATESPLCGFSHLWIKKAAPEYELLEDHFTQLWERGYRLFPFNKT
jgi:nucleoside phosphorylase